MPSTRAMVFVAALVAAGCGGSDVPDRQTPGTSGAAGSYQDLVALFGEWRTFERPAMRDGAPDYTAPALTRKHGELAAYQRRLQAIDPGAWPVPQQVDWHIVRAEMNGLDFYMRVLKPWERDPAFYATVFTDQSDTPAHEGPTNHAAVELWQYTFPVTADGEARLAGELASIPPLLAQARGNLIGNARDLWIAGIGSVKNQVGALDELERTVAAAGATLRKAVADAKTATSEFVAWLELQAPAKNGPSGIGRDNYTWSQQNVHLVPLTWEDEVAILKRELARAHASLRLEEQRNMGRPELVPAQNPAEYDQRAQAAVTRLMQFVADKEILTVTPAMDPAMRAKVGRFVPPETRNFFGIASHLEPNTLFTHFYHWWDLADMRDRPHESPIRRGPLLYNIWDSRAEGMSTAFEEMMMHAGLYDDNPRAREIQWIMLAQRAARGLGSLYAQSNEFTMKQAADFQVEWTPRGWMSPTLDLLGFEQQLYLRQPGYGTSYIIGKHLLEDLMRDLSHQRGDRFTMRGYFDDVNAAGLIPVSLIRRELTGRDE